MTTYTYNVYLENGIPEHIGTVVASNEDDARVAAILKFQISAHDVFSVNRT